MLAWFSLRRLAHLLWGHSRSNQLWQRISKSSISCAIALIVASIPQVVAVFGLNTYLIPMTSIFAHPGQRMAKMIETLLLIITGALLGLGWSILGLHLSAITMETNAPGASSIRAVFLLVAVLIHGFVRSSTPRLFVSVWLLLVVSATTLMGNATKVSLGVFTAIFYPILTGAAIVLIVNLLIWPEMSTSFLGSSTIETLSENTDTLSRATYWFVTPGGDSVEARRKLAESKKEKSDKKETWLTDFLSDFPNPLKMTSKDSSSEDALNLTTLSSLGERKVDLRAALSRCKAAQNEVNFEYSISPLPPNSLKPISKHYMSDLVRNVVALIGACENKFVLLKSGVAEGGTEEKNPGPNKLSRDGPPAPFASSILHQVAEDDEREYDEDDPQSRVDDVKPLREIESGSVDVLEAILRRLRGPVEELEAACKDATSLAIACIAYCFDVPKLPSGARRPDGIEVEEVDLRIDTFTEALARFDQRSVEELKLASMGKSGHNVDLTPRLEMFLVSSFLLGLRQVATHLLQMLRHARELVDQRRKRRDRARLWLPHYADLRQWLSTSGEDDARVLPETARKEVRTGKTRKPAPSPDSADNNSTSEDPLLWQKDDEENNRQSLKVEKPETRQKPPAPARTKTPKSRYAGPVSRLRGLAADALEWAQRSDDLVYALKLALAVFIVSWPSFVTSWRAWYGEVRGIWAPLQLVLVFEVSIGTSLFIFFVRLFGVIYGCVMGFASYEIARGNRAGMVVILVIGMVPCVYIQIATKYVKAGMIAITTMAVVALAAMNQSGTAVENFYKRLCAFLIGSLVAILVELLIYPVRARHRLVESLSASVRQVQKMHSAMSVGIDGPEKPNFRSHALHYRFQRARDKAQASLAAAETFLPFCLNEPRLKGSFRPLEPIYKEMIYVLHQIIGRMDNVIALRWAYGSSILEDLNAQVYAYRRNVAASNTLMLFSVHEALTSWLPLPQFIPSARLAQIRLVSRVREVLEAKMPNDNAASGVGLRTSPDERGEGVKHAASFVTQRKFLAWNANAAGHMEIIEYLEELVELTKLLVGVNAFRSGLLERPRYRDYVEGVKTGQKDPLGELLPSRSAPTEPLSPAAPASSLRRVATVAASVNRFRQIVRNNRAPQPAPAATQELTTVTSPTAVDRDDDADDSLPASLRRVGTRLRRDSTLVRRRGYSTNSAPESGHEKRL